MSQVKLAIISFPLHSLVSFCQKQTLVWTDVNTFASGLLEGQEDCLYINVYRPEAEEDAGGDEPQELLPVN